jgi:hypothetical protein
MPIDTTAAAAWATWVQPTISQHWLLDASRQVLDIAVGLPQSRSRPEVAGHELGSRSKAESAALQNDGGLKAINRRYRADRLAAVAEAHLHTQRGSNRGKLSKNGRKVDEDEII